MFISGKGLQVPLFFILGAVAYGFASVVIEAISPAMHAFTEARSISFILLGSTLLLALFSATSGRTKEEMRTHPASGETRAITITNHFLFLPPYAWTVVVAALSITSFVLIKPKAELEGESVPVASAEGGKALSNAELLITTKRRGFAHGNTNAAVVLAEGFSSAISKYRDEGIEESHRRTPITLTGGSFLTYCLLTEKRCIFLVHVPELNNFSKSAKSFISDAGWIAALQLLNERNLNPEIVGLGVRGMFLYEEARLGKSGPWENYDNLVDRVVSDNSNCRDLLAHQFDLARSENHGPVYDAEGPPVTERPSKGGTNTSADQVMDFPSGEMGEEKKVDRSTTAHSAQVSSPAKAPQSESRVPAAPEAPSLFASRTWTSRDGKTMTAAFVRFATDTGDVGVFRRDDGQVFEVPVARLSDPDQALISNRQENQVK